MESLHSLLPEFRSHIDDCHACGGFHEWILWRHRKGTNEWQTRCPATGTILTMPFIFLNDGDG